MGLFGKKEVCAVCGGKLQFGLGSKIADGTICFNCKIAGRVSDSALPYKSADELKKHIAEEDAKLSAFTPTDGVKESNLEMNRSTKKWKYLNNVFDFSELIDFELLEDGVSVTKGGVGSAIVGGALSGGVGAIVGSNVGKKQNDMCSKMSVMISTTDDFCPSVEIPFIVRETKKKSIQYRTAKASANKVMALLSVIENSQSNQEANLQPAQSSGADELLKFKQLLDAGAITKEEYDAKKKQILGL